MTWTEAQQAFREQKANGRDPVIVLVKVTPVEDFAVVEREWAKGKTITEIVEEQP